MNLLPKYVLVSKLINWITVKKNCIWNCLPIKLILDLTIKKNNLAVSTNHIQKKLSWILGWSGDSLPLDLEKSIKDDILLWADQALEHRFNILGSGIVRVDPIDWHTDFKTQFTWRKGIFYKKYSQVDLSNSADIKVVWELSRCHHLIWLGEAYMISHDGKYAKEVVSQIEHWIEENPLMYSINWTCSMEVAIRAVNWIYALNMVISAECINDEFTKKVHKSLYEHGFFIYNNFEKTFPYASNHYAANICGLIFISQLFDTLKSGKRWLDFAINEYFYEIRDEVLPSGVHFERSTSYHRLMTEIFSYTYLLLTRINCDIPLDIHYRVGSMFDFIHNYTKPNGLSPLIGDNDDGRFLPFYKYGYNDHEYLLSLSSILYHNSSTYQVHHKQCIDSQILLANLNQATFNKKSIIEDTLTSKSYLDAGFVIMRSQTAYIFINNSGLSKYPDKTYRINGTHTHADLLSFELSIMGEDIIIDPGTFTYTSSPQDRNAFRSTRKHNTISIDGHNQYGFSPDNLFIMEEFAKPSKLILNYLNDRDVCIAAYENVENICLTHERAFELYKSLNSCEIKDKISSEGQHFLSAYFHFAPGMQLNLANNLVEVRHPNLNGLTMAFDSKYELMFEVEQDHVSPSYGIKVDSYTLIVSTVFIDNCELSAKITWKRKN